MTCFLYQITMNHIKNIEQKAGGVLFYIGDSIQYNRPDLQMARNFNDNIFIEIKIQFLNITKDIIIGLIYRVPDSNTFFSIRNNQGILQKIYI